MKHQSPTSRLGCFSRPEPHNLYTHSGLCNHAHAKNTLALNYAHANLRFPGKGCTQATLLKLLAHNFADFKPNYQPFIYAQALGVIGNSRARQNETFDVVFSYKVFCPGITKSAHRVEIRYLQARREQRRRRTSTIDHKYDYTRRNAIHTQHNFGEQGVHPPFLNPDKTPRIPIVSNQTNGIVASVLDGFRDRKNLHHKAIGLMSTGSVDYRPRDGHRRASSAQLAKR
ncbi:hypothetical protein V8E55_007878 [Tylopilus felleus]